MFYGKVLKKKEMRMREREKASLACFPLCVYALQPAIRMFTHSWAQTEQE